MASLKMFMKVTDEAVESQLCSVSYNPLHRSAVCAGNFTYTPSAIITHIFCLAKQFRIFHLSFQDKIPVNPSPAPPPFFLTIGAIILYYQRLPAYYLGKAASLLLVWP